MNETRRARPIILLTGHRGVLGFEVAKEVENSIPDSEVVRFEGDITDNVAVADFLTEAPTVTHVIHTAAMVPVEEVASRPLEAYEVNGIAVGKFVEAVARTNPSVHVLHVSSSHVYKPTSGQKLKENSELGPVNAYGRTKLMGEYVLGDLSERLGIRVCIARVFSLYSERQEGSYLLPSITRKARESKGRTALPIRGGLNVRDFSHASDHARRLVHLSATSTLGIVNVGSGVGETVAEFATRMTRRTFTAMEEPDGATPNHIVADVTKLRETGWLS